MANADWVTQSQQPGLWMSRVGSGADPDGNPVILDAPGAVAGRGGVNVDWSKYGYNDAAYEQSPMDSEGNRIWDEPSRMTSGFKNWYDKQGFQAALSASNPNLSALLDRKGNYVSGSAYDSRTTGDLMTILIPLLAAAGGALAFGGAGAGASVAATGSAPSAGGIGTGAALSELGAGTTYGASAPVAFDAGSMGSIWGATGSGGQAGLSSALSYGGVGVPAFDAGSGGSIFGYGSSGSGDLFASGQGYGGVSTDFSQLGTAASDISPYGAGLTTYSPYSSYASPVLDAGTTSGGGLGFGESILDYLKKNPNQIRGGLSILNGLYSLGNSKAPLTGVQKDAAGRLQELQANPQSIQTMPGYAAGIQAVQRQQAAQGYTGSGNSAAALAQFGNQFYNNQVMQLMQLAGGGAAYTQNRNNVAGGLAQLGAGAGWLMQGSGG